MYIYIFVYTIIPSPVADSIILHDLIDDVFKMDDMTPLSVFLLTPNFFLFFILGASLFRIIARFVRDVI